MQSQTRLVPFQSSLLKLRRARKHLSELEAEIKYYFARSPVSLVVEHCPFLGPSEHHMWVAKIHEDVPFDLLPIIGDVVHNLRASLDLLACDLARINKQSAKDVYFPFSESLETFPDRIKSRNFHRAGKKAIELVKIMQPYKGGNILLRAIHDMDIDDKHKSLLPIIGGLTLEQQTVYRLDKNPIEIPGDFSTPIRADGQMICAMPKQDPIPLGMRVPANFFLIFDIESYGRCEVIDFLHRLEKVADDTTRSFMALFPGVSFP